MKKNILVFNHMQLENFNYSNGGTVAQYNLARILDELGENVRIWPGTGVCIENSIFNKFYKNDFPIDENAVVIYCEGTIGNPLNAPNAVRWMLSELGQNMDREFLHTWGKNELVYYFNSELKFEKEPEKINIVYKLLTSLYMNPCIKQTNFEERADFCYTIRKAHRIHKNGFVEQHPSDSFEITRDHTMVECVEIFNKYQWFICYDSLTFYIIVAALCGCVPIVYKVDGLSKKEWIQTTSAAEYCKSKGLDNLYGISYGQEDKEYAKNTIHLVKDQWNDILEFNKNNTIIPFINDINNSNDFNDMENTIGNNFFW